MRYDTLTPEQIDSLIAQCDQQLRITRGRERRERLIRKRELLVAAHAFVLERRRRATDRYPRRGARR